MRLQPGPLIRASAIALATLLAFGTVLLRSATSPTSAGYWTALAPSPVDGLYVADQGRHQLVFVDPFNGNRVLGTTPDGIYRSLAADAAGNFLLGTESGLFVSIDGGADWRFAIPGRRFTAVALGRDYWLAGAWNDALYRSDDNGSTWTRAIVPTGDVEFESLVPGFAATLLGLLWSQDGGRTWTPVPGSGDRMTAVAISDQQDGGVRAGDWYGRIWVYDRSAAELVVLRRCQGGVWSVAAKGYAATTSGLCPRGSGPPALLFDHEVTRVVANKATYVAVARGPIYSSGDWPWHVVYQPRG